MARKVGQIIARGDRRWLIRVYLGRDHGTKKRNYHNRTIRGSMREAQAYLTKKLRERDLGRDLEGAKITLNEYLDRWLDTAVKPRVRQKICQDYDARALVCPFLLQRLSRNFPHALWLISAATPTICTAFPSRLAALPKLCSDPRYRSNPIAHRVRRKRQRLPPSLLIENASGQRCFHPKVSVRGVSDQS
jgi:hypothetical protein